MFDAQRGPWLSLVVAAFCGVRGWPVAGADAAPLLKQNPTALSVKAGPYGFEWSAENDRFRVLDPQKRVAVSGQLQPAVVVRPAGPNGARVCTSGKVESWNSTADRLSVAYQGVNGNRRLELTIRFEPDGFWLEPVAYHSGPEDVVALHLFAEGNGTAALPALSATHWVVPGLSESSGLGPLVQAEMGLSQVLWLGRGATGEPGILQQWGLPAHYFGALTRGADGINQREALSQRLSGAWCCGLAELPAADLLLDLRGSRAALIFSYRSDLWGQARGPGKLMLGARLYATVGANYYEAIRSYYRGLTRAGLVHPKQHSPAKISNLLTPQFNSWGAQVAMGKESAKFDERAFEEIYAGLQACGMKAGMFVFDDKWEGVYGGLAHSAERFPHFEQILARLRGQGRRIGLWAAFLRVEHPEALGLTTEHVLHRTDGTPYRTGPGAAPYCLLDVTQPEVQTVLRDVARRFVRRYRPDLVKFDFGYELPSLSVAAPRDKSLAGERLFHKAVEIVAQALREENPDIALMYYSLSPLFVDHLDLHSPDDLFLCQGEYDLEANRRYFFSSLLGELGLPTYGSGGYDWETMPAIWFDSAAVGTLGSLLAFSGDEKGQYPRPDWVAKFNGVAQALRPSATFSIEPLEVDWLGPARAARAASWVRREAGKVVLVALRTRRWDGRVGAGKYLDLISATAAVIVSSRTPEAITRASQLVLVPYGEGEVAIRREGGPAAAELKEHAFDGQVSTSRVRLKDGWLRVKLRERTRGGSPVEWLEASF